MSFFDSIQSKEGSIYESQTARDTHVNEILSRYKRINLYENSSKLANKKLKTSSKLFLKTTAKSVLAISVKVL